MSAPLRIGLGASQTLLGPSHISRWPVVAARLQLAGELPGGAVRRLLQALEAQPLPFPVHPLWPGDPDAESDAAVAVAACALALQRAVGLDLRAHGRLGRRGGPPGCWLEYLVPDLALSALELAAGLLQQAAGEDAALAETAAAALHRLRAERPPRVALLQVRQIHRSGLPWRRLANPPATLEVGYGAAARRLRIMLPDDQGIPGYRMCADKTTTLELLRAAGLPVPESQPAPSCQAAVDFARRIGFPVVLKPREGSLAKDVAVNLRDEAELSAAWARRPVGARMVVERFVRGEPYRLLVIDGRLVHAIQRFAPEVVGDGHASLAALIERMNHEPERRSNDDMSLDPFDPAEDAHALACLLAAQELTMDSVPAAGRVVRLGYVPVHPFRRTEDVMDRLHPAVAELAVAAAEALDMKTAGVDYLTPDISEPPERQGSAINEVNAAPWISVHVMAAPNLNLTEPLLRRRLGASEGRIPLAAMAGSLPAGLAEQVVRWMRRAGRDFALAGAAGARLADGRPLPRNRRHSPAAQLLRDRRVAAALLVLEPQTYLAEGLPFDLCDLGILGPAADQAGHLLAATLAAASRRALLAPASQLAPLVPSAPAGRRHLAVAEEGTAPPPGAALLRAEGRTVILVTPEEGASAFPLPADCDASLGPWLVGALLGLGLQPAQLPSLLAGSAELSG